MADFFKELPVISAGPKMHEYGQAEPIIGIDLGTTNSLVAIVENGVARIIPTSEGLRLLPSFLHLVGDEFEIGQKARRCRVRDSQKTISSVKRLLGKSLRDIEDIRQGFPFDLSEDARGNILISVAGKKLSPIEISARILSNLKEAAEKDLGRKVEDAVVTVPAYFNDSQRQATRAAGRLAGLNILRILNEPTAAALAYGLSKKKNGTIAVYDLGGGTFDVSILRLNDGVFEVLATGGDTQLGGDDIDQSIAKFIATEKLSTVDNSLLITSENRALLLEVAEELKIELSQKKSTSKRFEIAGQEIEISLSQDDLGVLIAGLLSRTKATVERTLADAAVTMHELSDVVLVGGPTKLPVVQKFVEGIFKKTAAKSINPDEVVAVGAAIQADILAGNNREFLLLDVVPLSLGIETFGGTMNKLILRNSRIPTLAKEQFTTYVDGQKNVSIAIFQGERELVAENRKLGEFILRDVPPLPAGTPRIEVTFLVDADGILNVSAKELYSDARASVEVKPTYGLTDEEVERMLADGLAHQETDREKAALIEARNDAKTILNAARKSLASISTLLDQKEIENIQAAIADLETKLQEENLEALKKSHQRLNDCTKNLAQLLMSDTLEKNLKNQNIRDILK